MRKVLLTVLLVMVLAVPAFALLDDNSTNYDQSQMSDNTNEQAQGQIGINENDNRDYNDVDNRNAQEQENRQSQGQGQDQGQLQNAIAAQGQIGIVGQVSDQGNEQMTNIDASENNKTKVYANSWPGINGEIGTNNFNGHSIFGGLGISSTAAYKICIEKLANIKMMEDCGYFTHEEAVEEAKLAWKQFRHITRDKRFLGVLWKTSDRDLLNVFGLLAWDSFWSE